jgi:hypothetical protein
MIVSIRATFVVEMDVRSVNIEAAKGSFVEEYTSYLAGLTNQELWEDLKAGFDPANFQVVSVRA